jgi:hypothetical protein
MTRSHGSAPTRIGYPLLGRRLLTAADGCYTLSLTTASNA